MDMETLLEKRSYLLEDIASLEAQSPRLLAFRAQTLGGGATPEEYIASQRASLEALLVLLDARIEGLRESHPDMQEGSQD